MPLLYSQHARKSPITTFNIIQLFFSVPSRSRFVRVSLPGVPRFAVARGVFLWLGNILIGQATYFLNRQRILIMVSMNLKEFTEWEKREKKGEK